MTPVPWSPQTAVLGYLGFRPRKAVSRREVVDRVREGLAARNVRQFLERFGLTLDELDRDIRLAKSTVARTLKQGSRFSPAQSDKIGRLADAVAQAVHVFESEERAMRWLRGPNPALGGDKPLALLDTDSGARMVEEVLGRIEYGVYS